MDRRALVQGLVLMYSFFLLTAILLLNMLIAMMSQSYEETLETANANYHLRFAQTVLEYKALPPTPPPLYALSLPFEAASLAWTLLRDGLSFFTKCFTCTSDVGEASELDSDVPPVHDGGDHHALASRALSRHVDRMVAFISKRTARLGKDEKLERINECAARRATRLATSVARHHALTHALPRSLLTTGSVPS
jgi:hypothetical protein